MSSSPAFAKHPEHKIRIVPHSEQISVWFEGVEIAKSDRALEMYEGTYNVVYYLPFEDCNSEYFTNSTHTSFCPFKGTASYWSLKHNSDQVENAVWGYERPFDEMLEIKHHVAFYRNKVDIKISAGK